MNTISIISLLFAVPLFSGLLMIRHHQAILKNIKLLLSFSASFLLSVCLIHLLPEVFSFSSNIGLFVLIGFFIQIILEYFSSGIEHGHMHKDSTRAFPFVIFVSLFIHSFIEGFPLGNENLTALGTDKSLALLSGILIHKVPIAVVLTGLLLGKHASLRTTVIALLVFAFSAPLGVFAANYLSELSDLGLSNYLTAITIGIFLHVSTVILFESSENHRFNTNKFLAILAGLALALWVFGMH